MPCMHRDATVAGLPRIVEIYNRVVASRTCSCDLEPTTVQARRPSFLQHGPGRRPFWAAEGPALPEEGVAGDLGISHSVNERAGRFITADLAIDPHPRHQGRGLGTYLVAQAIDRGPALGIETLTATIFADNEASIALFKKMGFEQWSFMPRVARLEGVEKDLVLVGRRVAEPAARPG